MLLKQVVMLSIYIYSVCSLALLLSLPNEGYGSRDTVVMDLKKVNLSTDTTVNALSSVDDEEENYIIIPVDLDDVDGDGYGNGKFNSTKVCVDSSIIVPPTERMSLAVSRWIIIIGTIVIFINCLICVFVFFYCKCKNLNRMRRRLNNGLSYNNSRSTILPVPTHVRPSASGALRNSTDLPTFLVYRPAEIVGQVLNGDRNRALKALEKDPSKQFSQLVLDV